MKHFEELRCRVHIEPTAVGIAFIAILAATLLTALS